MNSYKIYLHEPSEGILILHYKSNGQINSVDFSGANLSEKRLLQIVQSMPVLEDDFIRRATRSMTKYEKI